MSGLAFLDYSFKLHGRGGHTVSFQAARQDTDGQPRYYGWLSEDGSYVIMEQDTTDPADTTMKYFYVRFKSTAQSFQDAWDDRTNKSYVDYNAIFD